MKRVYVFPRMLKDLLFHSLFRGGGGLLTVVKEPITCISACILGIMQEVEGGNAKIPLSPSLDGTTGSWGEV